MMKRLKVAQSVYLLTTAGFLAGPPAARAQSGGAASSAGADTISLTLERALDIAAGSNPAYRKAENALELNPVEMRSTWFDQILPSANLTLFSTSYTGNLTHRGIDPLGNPISNPTSDWIYYSGTQQQLSLNWSIRGNSLFHRYKGQKLTNQGRAVAADQAVTTMQISVRRLYNDAMKQRDLLAAERDLVEARKVDKDVADRLFSLALRTRVDVLNADLGIERQSLAVQTQSAAYQTAILKLRTQLGDENLGPIRLADESLRVFDPSALDADALVEQALDENPDLRQARVGVDQERETVAQANTLWWPSLSFYWNVGRTAQRQESAALFDMSYNEPMDNRFGISLSFPMFNDFFQNRAQQAQAHVALQNAREDERQARLDLEQKVRGALLELNNQYQTLQTNQQAEHIAQEALRLAREEYRIGTRTFAELRTTIDDEANSRRQVIQSRYSFVDALITLEEAVGASIAPPGGD
jgi:outer membrane protein TolC